MNRRDLLKASAARAALAANIFGYRAARADGVGDVYIDPGVIGTGHSGTYADPFSTADALIFFWLLLGNQNNRRIRFRAGTTFVGYVAIDGCDNYLLEPYGDGAAPVISNHVDISNLTWEPDDGVWGGPDDDVWYIAAAGGISTWTAGETAVIFNDGTDDIQCEARTSYAGLVGPQYECNEANYSTTPFMQYWDTTTSPNRMWVKVPPGFDPNAATVLRPFADQNVMTLSGGTGVQVSDMVLQCGAIGGFLAHEVSGLTLTRVAGRNIGGRSSAAQNVFSIVGVSKEFRSTDIVMSSCSAYRSVQRTSSHGLEISWLDRLTVDDFVVRDVRLHGIEFWNSCSNVAIRRMTGRQCGASLLTFQDSADEAPGECLHDNVLIQNSECVQRASYVHHAASGLQSGGSGIVTCPYPTNRKFVSDVRIYNNSFDLDSAFVLYASIGDSAVPGLGNNAVTFKNNVCRFSQITGSTWGGVYAPAVNSAADDWVMDNNVYQFAVTANNGLYVSGTAVSSQAGWRSAWDAVPGATANEDHSVVTTVGLFMVPGGSLKTTDLALINEVTAAAGRADSGDARTPTTDILGVARDGAPDAGAYEYVPGSDSTPAPVQFPSQTDVPTSQAIPSAVITITGLTQGATISVVNGSYEIDGSGSFVTSTGTIYNGQTLRVMLNSSSSPGTPATVTATVGGIDITFTATTAVEPTGPAQFTFTHFSGSDIYTTYTSLPVSITGLSAAAGISVAGDPSAQYSVNSTSAFTSLPGTVVNGDVIRARVTTGGDGGIPYEAEITVNGVMGPYRVTTDGLA